MKNPFQKTIQENFSRITNSPEGRASVEIISALEKSWKDKKSFAALSIYEKSEWKKASLNLWGSYTIYDHLMDGGTSLSELPAANLLLFQSAKILSGPSKIAENIFLLMEQANQEEFKRVQEIKKDQKYWSKLDEKIILENGHQKSLGLYLVVFVFLEKRKVTLAEQNKFKKFLISFLNCRQLADDLYDWRDDLQDNIPTAVTVSLMKKFKNKKDNFSQLEVEVFQNLYPYFHNYLKKTLQAAIRQAEKISVLEKNNFLTVWAKQFLQGEQERWEDYQKLLAKTKNPA